MPPAPPTIPANIHQVLSSIRSSVFLNVHNPTGARLGTKYLRKGLAGPALLNYYSKPVPKPAALDRQFNHHVRQSEAAFLKSGGDVREIERWKREGQVAPGYIAAPNLPQAQNAKGIFWDEREDARLRFVERRQRLGKGTTPKGE
jgi:small subunit ribosomal protein S33